jgi:hypothetical protein
MAWRLMKCWWHDQQRLEAFLRSGWEPFAVTDTGRGEETIWLRRSVYPSEAGVESEQHRSEPEVAGP